MNSLSSKSKLIPHFLLSRSPSSFSPSSSKILCISLFSTFSSSSSSSSSSHYSSHSPSRRYDEESKNVRVSVWWDIENCSIPNGVNVFKIAHFITSAVRATGIKGPIQVTAFGDIFWLTKANQAALSSTGVNLVHIPHGGKNNADRSLLVDLMYWVSQNPPPAHVFLISGDRDFAGILHKLRMNNYNILLAGRDGKSTPGVLCSAASVMWNWTELAKGENLSGRHFNQPPDGPFNSWYGHYRGPLEDPFEVSEQKQCLETDNSSNSELSSETKRRPVPLAIFRHIRRIVNAYPEGLTCNELQGYLTKHKVAIDKDYYGYKKFSRFLQSMPQILRVECCSDGQLVIHPVPPKMRKLAECNDTSIELGTEKKSLNTEVTRKENAQTHTITRMVDVEPQLPVSSSVTCGERSVADKMRKDIPKKKKLSDPQIDNQVACVKELPGKQESKAVVVEIPVPPKEEQRSESKIGLFKRLWFGTGADAQETNTDNPDNLIRPCDTPKLSTPEEEEFKSTDEHGVHCPAQSSSSTTSNENAESDVSKKHEGSPGFFTKVMSWFKFWRKPSVKTSCEQPSEGSRLIEDTSKEFDVVSHSKKHEAELFSKNTFWISLQSFIKTRRGSDIVLNSTSREHFAERLHKEGPLVLRPLQESDLRHLVDLLISEKRWIAEFPTRTPRFRIIQSSVNSSVELQPPHSSNGLSSIFMDSSAQENPHLKVASSSNKKPSEKSRGEVLADCQTLLDELLSQHPQGFNLGLFRKCFVEKYEYGLDHYKLGYPKLVSLVQIMPGVKVEGTYVFPDNVTFSPSIHSTGLTEKSSGSDSDLSDSAESNRGGENTWDELGPVAKQKIKSTLDQVNGTYEPSVSDDDDFSELEEDATSSRAKAEDQKRWKVDEDDSTLMQILDSWYSPDGSKDPGSHPEVLAGSSKEGSETTPQSSSTNVKGEAAAAGWKQRSQKSYVFVADPGEAKKDMLIDGILGSMKKSGDSKMQE